MRDPRETAEAIVSGGLTTIQVPMATTRQQLIELAQAYLDALGNDASDPDQEAA